ncbi:MAG: 23S rRNA (adenine(2503)-C(2))-methyltransferase RlmN [Pyrinomonas sp.]|uniref:23S rRNA (adenine(2503)-C(2))-methyltransferase RlmN n=1 Tax=Pyrinomonas sp. TaxID=2080306 RepID=UPI0033223F57
MAKPVHALGLSLDEAIRFVEDLGERPFRGRQLFSALHQRRVRSFAEITDLPKAFRALLAARAAVSSLALEARYVSADGTRRYLFRTQDGHPVETVFIPEERRDTICFSSQAGCALACDFCLTARLGLRRSLTAGEIVEQIICALNDVYGEASDVPHGTNLVAMGAGEPLLAFEALVKALRIMAAPEGLHIVPRRVTVSTAGIVPRIRQLAEMQDRPHLAISLSAPTDELRDRLMPINRRWPLAELMAACRDFQRSLKPGERLTFEYVMLSGVNDANEHAHQLARLLNQHQLRAKVNLIPHNTAESLPYRPSSDERIEAFQRILEAKGIRAFVRRPRGRDIFAACGQLAARHLSVVSVSNEVRRG